MEGKRADFATDIPEPLMALAKYPLVGASIGAVATDCGTLGTLGGYIVADGTVYALTNHHVVFGKDRVEPFPSPTEISDSVIIHQPPKSELDRAIETEEYAVTIHENFLKRTSDTNEREIHESQIRIHQNRLKTLRKWYGMSLTLGTVTKSSGISMIPVSRRSRDWAVVKVGDEDRGTADTTKFINEASDSA